MKMNREYGLNTFLHCISAANAAALEEAKAYLASENALDGTTSVTQYDTPNIISHCGAGLEPIVCLTRKESDTCWAGYIRNAIRDGWRDTIKVVAHEVILEHLDNGSVKLWA